MKLFFLILIPFFLLGCTQQASLPEEPSSDFCGTSSFAACEESTDCVSDGCSGQICRSSQEEGWETTCEWEECYDESLYGISCSCVDNTCQWA